MIVYDVISNILWAAINTYTYIVLVFIMIWDNRKHLRQRYMVIFILLCFGIELAQRFAFLKFPSSIFWFSILDPVFILLRVVSIMFFFDTKLWKAFVLVGSYFVGYSLSYLLMAKLISIRTPLTFEEGFPFYTRLMDEMSLMAVVILFFYVIIILLGIVRRTKNAPKISPAHAIGVLLPSLLYIVGYFFIFPFMAKIENSDFPFIIGTIMFAINVAVLMIIVDADKKNVHLYYLDEQYKRQKQYFSQIEENNLAIRKRAHDEHKHYVYITGLLRQGEYDRLEEYLFSLNERTLEFSDLVVTGNFDIDTILNAKIVEAREAGCHIEVNGQLPPYLEIDPVDFCVLIGNCMDNAIVACLKTNERKIKVDFTYYKQMLFIRLQNTYIPPNKIISVNNESVGDIKKKSGIGLAIMGTVAKKYNGNLEVIRNGNIFVTEIFLFAPMKEGAELRIKTKLEKEIKKEV